MIHAFDLTGPLPTTTTLLEASAGTGKTYAIAALATRFLAQRPDLDVTQLLMITFGNHAAGELRSRVFKRLHHTLQQLEQHLAGTTPTEADAVDRLLMSKDAKTHRDRIAAALERYNEATILTTHAFCESMLRELGVLGDWDQAEVVGPDDRELARQCASDTYLRFHRDEPDPPFTAKDAMTIGIAACETPLPLLPQDGPRHDFAAAVRELYAARKVTEGICTFDDVIERLRAALTDPRTGDLVRERLATRFPVVLVDEFQDTDPEQWDIIERAFVAAERPTILIGDPKQSIYGFRGADLGSYLRARQRADVQTLSTNYRTDRPLVQGVIELFGDAELGSSEVKVTPVDASHATRLAVPGESRLWLRRCGVDELGPGVDADSAIEHDLVRQARLLLRHARFVDGGAPLRPGDIAVLTRTTARAREIRSVLTAAGLPAVLTGSQSVWQQEAADDWQRLLRAMADPTQSHIRLAALTPLIGSQLGELLRDSSPEPARVSTLVRELSLAFDSGGIGAVVTVLRSGAGLDARVLAEADGARRLTDLLHVAELLDASDAHTVPGLLAVLAERGSDEDESDSIRIESDDEAIRVMTMHAAKGLEFPVVLLPETGGSQVRTGQPFSVIEGNRRHLYVGERPDWRDELAKDVNRQNIEEELRLLYVAMTRACHLTVAWHVSDARRASSDGPLSQLLSRHGWRHRKDGETQLIRLASVFDSLLDDSPPGQVDAVVPDAGAPLTLATLPRLIDHTWRRTSYSGLTQGLHETAVRVVVDEVADLDLTPVTDVPPELQALSPMADLPAGAGFGTLVHEALEKLDWAPARLSASATLLLSELGPANGLDAAQSAQLASALEQLCLTPLLPLTTESLSDLPTSSRLPELDFDLPLADSGAPASLADLAALMDEHLTPEDPLADYPRRLASSEAAPAVLNGFLTGSIDAVLRLADGRFVVVDYKTNRLSPSPADPLTLAHYTAPSMAEAMMQAHYPLQASLYCVALHRHLSLRLPGYDPETHLGGVGYLFVRGMAGPDTPVVDGTTCGVFGWYPPAAFVLAASELLGGHRG